MNTKSIIGLILWGAAVFLICMISGSHLRTFINVPAVLFVAMGVGGALLLTSSPQQSREDRLKTAAQAAMHSGWISFILVLITLLGSGDPQIIVPDMAVALPSVLYGALVSLVCCTLSQKN